MPSEILELLHKSLSLLAKQYGKDLEPAKITIESLGEKIKDLNIPVENVFSEAAIIAARGNGNAESRNARLNLSYITSKRPKDELVYAEDSKCKYFLNVDSIKNSVLSANKAIELIHDLSSLYGIDFFIILGMRNLSAFVGEVFSREVHRNCPEQFIVNPNQDGYPDLCAMTEDGKQYVLKNSAKNGTLNRDKTLWSPFPFHGIEVKATCGNTPAASKVAKPIIGESRLPILVSAEWKAHHQQTKVLLAIYWDFVDGLPTVLAVFFRNDLDNREGSINRDWAPIIHPKEGGGRTTSVSIMRRGSNKSEGVKKMGQGWLVLPNNKEMLAKLDSIFSFS